LKRDTHGTFLEEHLRTEKILQSTSSNSMVFVEF